MSSVKHLGSVLPAVTLSLVCDDGIRIALSASSGRRMEVCGLVPDPSQEALDVLARP